MHVIVFYFVFLLSLSNLFGAFPILQQTNKDSNNTDKKSGSKKNTKKTNSKSETGNKNLSLKEDDKKSHNNEIKDANNDIEEPIVPKPKKQPLVPPGEWVAPQMEVALSAVFDKLVNKVGSVTHTFYNGEFKKSELKPTTSTFELDESEDESFATKIVDTVLVKLSNGVVLETLR